jgi:hypothetical protein
LIGLHGITEDISMSGRSAANEALVYKTLKKNNFGVTVSEGMLINITCNHCHAMTEHAIQSGFSTYRKIMSQEMQFVKHSMWHDLVSQ